MAVFLEGETPGWHLHVRYFQLLLRQRKIPFSHSLTDRIPEPTLVSLIFFAMLLSLPGLFVFTFGFRVIIHWSYMLVTILIISVGGFLILTSRRIYVNAVKEWMRNWKLYKDYCEQKGYPDIIKIIED